MITRMKEKLAPIKLNTWAYQTVIGLLEARVGGNQVKIVVYSSTRDIVWWQGNRTVVHWVLYPVGGKCEPWVIAPNVMSSSGYLRWRLLNK